MPWQEDEIAEYYDDLQASGGAGTILRPMHGTARRDHTLRWGDTLDLPFRVGGGFEVVSGQFLNLAFPAPRVCSIAFNATLISDDPTDEFALAFTTFELFVGLGSSNYTRKIAFTNLPQTNPASSLDYVLSDLPVLNLYVRASAQAYLLGQARNTVHITGQIAPVESV